MSVENECKDACQQYDELRKQDKSKSLINNPEIGEVISDTTELADALLNDARLNDTVPESFDDNILTMMKNKLQMQMQSIQQMKS